MDLQKLKYDENGLIPAVVQDFHTGEVLTVAYMNEESLKISIDEKRTCFWSRSRKELWRKGETSGNFQHIVSITADCDFDALVVKVIKDGPACHLGTNSCFTNVLLCDETVGRFALESLYELLVERNKLRPEGSYTTYLFEKGKDKILKKVGEETTEVIVAAKNEGTAELQYETADLLYHLMVLLVEQGLTYDDIKEELGKREGLMSDFKDRPEIKDL